ncbi:MAG TPA: hypothetical protein VH682_04550 [Gemmataceae bacterium]|jgi:hypothetical protein
MPLQFSSDEDRCPPAFLGVKPRRFNVSDARLTPLIKKGQKEFSIWKTAFGACKSMGILAGITGLSAGVGKVFQSAGVNGMTGVVGMGTIPKAGIAAYQGVSTGSDIEELGKRFKESKDRCFCGHCEEIYDYIFDQLQLKAAKQYVSFVPVIGLLSTAGFALHGAYKRAAGTLGVERHKYACMLWVCAKDGCPCAKAMIHQLFDCEGSALADVLSSYAGIEAIARKIQSK